MAPPRIQETPSDEDTDDLVEGDEDVVYSEEDQDELESEASVDAPTAPSRSRSRPSIPPRLPVPTAPIPRVKARAGKTGLSSELSSLPGGGNDMEDELASDEPEDDDEEPSSSSQKGKPRAGLKLKLKVVGGDGTAVNPAVERAKAGTSRRASSAASSTAASSRSKGKKRARDDGDSDSDSGSEHGSESSALSLTRLTARQRAKEIGDPGEELYALPTHSKSKNKYAGLNETEIALKRDEDTRKRQSQVNKRLEDEKQETINRLLKKQTGKGVGRGNGRAKGKKSGAATPALDDDGAETPVPVIAVPVLPPPPPIGYRHVSSIRSGEFGVVLRVPLGKEDRFAPRTAAGYPGPRPPLKTRHLTAAAA